MSGHAKTTMLLYANPSPEEQRKLELLDNSVSVVLIRAGITDRAIWISATESDHRVVRLCAGKRTVLDIDSGELATIPEKTLLSRLGKGANHPG